MKVFNKIISFFKNKDKETMFSLKDFIDFCEKSIGLLFFTIVFLILFHSYLMNNSNVGIDTDTFIHNPTSNYNWTEIGRFGLVIEKSLLYLTSYSIFYSEVLTMFFLFSFYVFTYYLIYKVSGRDFKYYNLIIPIICFSSPIWAEQFIFTLQIAEISFALNLCVISVIYIYKWIVGKSYLSCFIGILSGVLLIASYQSLVIIYIALLLISFILLYENENEIVIDKIKDKNIIKVILKIIFAFIASYGIYQILIKILKVDTSYLNGSNGWHIYFSRREVVKNIYSHCRSIIKGEGLFYNLGLPVSMIAIVIIGIYNTIKNTKLNKWFYKLLYLSSFGALCITPFLLTILLGQASVVRAQIYIPFIESLLMMIVFEFVSKKININILKYAMILFVVYITFYQTYYLESLYYTDSMTREKDKQLAILIGLELKAAGASNEDRVYFYGHYNGIDNPSIIKGQLIGTSAFEFNHTIEPMYFYSTEKIVYLMRAYDFKYSVLPKEYVFDARVLAAPETVPSWPKEGSIIKCDGYYLVKLENF